jgi:hypothetical protein
MYSLSYWKHLKLKAWGHDRGNLEGIQESIIETNAAR